MSSSFFCYRFETKAVPTLHLDRKMQATHSDLMYYGVQHMIALIFDAYCDTMPGTLQILINLTLPPKHVFPYTFFGIELQSGG